MPLESVLRAPKDPMLACIAYGLEGDCDMQTSSQKPTDQLAPRPLYDRVPAPEWVQLLIGQGACMRQMRKTAHSHVLEVYSDHGRYYLKRNPPGYIHEAKLLTLLNNPSLSNESKNPRRRPRGEKTA